MRRIDVHHHIFPAELKKDESYHTFGWRAPSGHIPWSPEISLRLMEAARIDVAILSMPASPLGSISPADRACARARNVELFRIRAEYPGRFGFYACLPFLDDVEGALEEIAYALDELHADGISLSSSYGDGPQTTYIGHDRYDSIWAALNARDAVVFLHGAQILPSTPYPHLTLGIPVTEVPNETFKAAAHLVVTGRKRKYPNVQIILAHLGGNAPFLAPRVAVLAGHMGCTLTPEEVIADFATFYYDTALSAHTITLSAMDALVQSDRMLFGTDFPAVSTQMAMWYTDNLEEHYSNDPEKIQKIMCTNALRLFPGLENPV